MYPPGCLQRDSLRFTDVSMVTSVTIVMVTSVTIVIVTDDVTMISRVL